jgi:hypothetical protein
VAEVSDFDRGHIAGGIAERLAGHDKHFATINGSLEKIARELHAFALAMQRLADQAEAREATAVATATALREAESARRAHSDRRWSPWAKLLAVAAVLVAAAGVGVAVWLAQR